MYFANAIFACLVLIFSTAIYDKLCIDINGCPLYETVNAKVIKTGCTFSDNVTCSIYVLDIDHKNNSIVSVNPYQITYFNKYKPGTVHQMYRSTVDNVFFLKEDLDTSAFIAFILLVLTIIIFIVYKKNEN